jgi:hypothetical protein
LGGACAVPGVVPGAVPAAVPEGGAEGGGDDGGGDDADAAAAAAVVVATLAGWAGGVGDEVAGGDDLAARDVDGAVAEPAAATPVPGPTLPATGEAVAPVFGAAPAAAPAPQPSTGASVTNRRAIDFARMLTALLLLASLATGSALGTVARYFLMSTSSTSNVNVEFGGMTLPIP